MKWYVCYKAMIHSYILWCDDVMMHTTLCTLWCTCMPWCDDTLLCTMMYTCWWCINDAHCMMMMRWVDDYQTLMMTCSDLDVWWLDSNQQCWWAAWPAVLMFNMTVIIWAKRWCDNNKYRDDLTVTRVQRLSAAEFGMWQVHRFDNLLLIRVAGWGKERRS